MANHRELASVLYDNTLGRASASRIWRTVVFAGAMLGTPACHHDKPPATPAESTATDPAPAPTPATPATPVAADQAATPATPATDDPPKQDDPPAPAKRPRSTGDSRPHGRGFVLS